MWVVEAIGRDVPMAHNGEVAKVSVRSGVFRKIGCEALKQRIVLTRHARERMAERAVTVQQLREALRRGIYHHNASDVNGIETYTACFRSLDVVFRLKAEESVVVITVFWEQKR